MNNNIPIARWLSMFWLCSAVSLVLGQFSGSVTLNGTNGAALTVTGILGIFCTLVQFYPFYRFSRVSERIRWCFYLSLIDILLRMLPTSIPIFLSQVASLVLLALFIRAAYQAEKLTV